MQPTIQNNETPREPARLFITLGATPVVRIWAEDYQQEIEVRRLAELVEGVIADAITRTNGLFDMAHKSGARL